MFSNNNFQFLNTCTKRALVPIVGHISREHKIIKPRPKGVGIWIRSILWLGFILNRSMAYNVPPQLKTVIGIAESNQEIKKKNSIN